MTNLVSANGIQNGGSKQAALRFLANYGFLPIILVVLCIAFGLMEPRFLTFDNALNIIEQSSYLIVLGLAQMFVLLVRGFDLSLGVVVSAIGVATAMLIVAIAPGGEGSVALSLLVGFCAAIAMGVLAGVINGTLVAYLDINPFVVTLGTQGVAFGIATTISGGFPVMDLPPALTGLLGQNGSLFGPVPPPVAICLAAMLISSLVLNRTVFGRSLYIIGSSPKAAEVGGLPWRRFTMLSYVACSILVAIGAILMMARTGTGEPSTGAGLRASQHRRCRGRWGVATRR